MSCEHGWRCVRKLTTYPFSRTFSKVHITLIHENFWMKFRTASLRVRIVYRGSEIGEVRFTKVISACLCCQNMRTYTESYDWENTLETFIHISSSSRKLLRASEGEEFNKKWAKSQIKFSEFVRNFWKNFEKFVFLRLQGDLCDIQLWKMMCCQFLIH